MGAKEQMSGFFAELDPNFIDPLIENILKSDYAKPPPNSLVSEEVWKEKARSDLKRYFHMDSLFELIDSGFEEIGHDLALISPIEREKLQNEWMQGLRRLLDRYKDEGDAKEADSTEKADETLEEVMGLSENTIGYFYKVGLKLYQHHQYQKASHVFSLLTMLNMGRHDVWMALGLAELQQQNYEIALNAFAMAAITDIDDPVCYIHSAECCIGLSNPQEAHIFLDIAAEKLSQVTNDRKQAFLEHINKLKLELQKNR